MPQNVRQIASREMHHFITADYIKVIARHWPTRKFDHASSRKCCCVIVPSAQIMAFHTLLSCWTGATDTLAAAPSLALLATISASAAPQIFHISFLLYRRQYRGSATMPTRIVTGRMHDCPARRFQRHRNETSQISPSSSAKPLIAIDIGARRIILRVITKKASRRCRRFIGAVCKDDMISWCCPGNIVE